MFGRMWFIAAVFLGVREQVMSWRSGQSYSADLRERVLTAVDQGLSVGEVARRLAYRSFTKR